VTEGEVERLVPVTVPIPVIERLAALLVVQLKVEDCPALIIEGEAVKELIVGGAPEAILTVTVVALVTLLLALLAVKV
jgi:hypothetical protein